MKFTIYTLLLLFFITSNSNAQSNKITPITATKGKLLFSDDFNRKEIGNQWEIKEKFNGAFTIEKGTLVSKELKHAGHGSVTRAHFNFSDVIIEFDFKFKGGKRFNMVMDDSKCKTVWAGHISRVSFTKNSFYVQDDKTGTMNLEVRKKRKQNPNSNKLKKLINSKKSIVKHAFKDGEWYHVKIIKKGDILQCNVNNYIAQIQSEGISHPKLNKFGPTITGAAILFDNFKIWETH
ncbi:family 16 glycoside hydrolase [Wenyingzhuangia sp. IMCC45574]